MTEEQDQRQREMHDWLFKPSSPKGQTRAEQLDAILFGRRFIAVGGRGLVYITALVVAIKAALDALGLQW